MRRQIIGDALEAGRVPSRAGGLRGGRDRRAQRDRSRCFDVVYVPGVQVSGSVPLRRRPPAADASAARKAATRQDHGHAGDDHRPPRRPQGQPRRARRGRRATAPSAGLPPLLRRFKLRTRASAHAHAGTVRRMPNALAGETSPYLLQHRDNPVDWLPWGERGAGPRARARPPAARLDRLLGLPLVPRHGARVLRGRRDRRAHERALRLRQGRPRGAPRRRRDLHGGRAGDDRPRRLAAERLHHARAGAVLRRHVLPARAAPRHARAGRRCSAAVAEGVGAAARRDPRAERGDGRAAVGRRAAAARRAAAGRGRARRRRRAAARDASTRSTAAGAARRSSPPPRRSSSCCAAARRPMALQTLRSMASGGINDQIGGGFARYSVDATWTVPHFEKMLYDNALLARAYLHGWQVSRRSDPAPHRRGDARLGAARDDRARGRLLLGARRRLRGRRGQVLRLDDRRAARRARRRRRRRARLVRRERARQLRGHEHPRVARRRARARGARADPRRAARGARASACARASTTSA